MLTYSKITRSKYSAISVWLSICCFMVILMIAIGGYTRLTESGLSITEWKPITGIIPPLNSEEWLIEFSKYQTSPEYLQHNSTISLSNFKYIYIVEYIHRLAGRITCLIYLLPLIYFFYHNKLYKKDLKVYCAILLLFVIQGTMGWYMVKSGLLSTPAVGHFRLAIHLCLAIGIYALLFWQLMKTKVDILLISNKNNLKNIKFTCIFSLVLLSLQIFIGALVAGLKAGLVYNSFPLMGNSFVPLEVDYFIPTIQSFNDPVFVQFLHRISAYLLTITIAIFIFMLVWTKNIRLKKIALVTSLALILQILVGILIIIHSVPIILAIFHQVLAVVLLSCLMRCYFLVNGTLEC